MAQRIALLHYSGPPVVGGVELVIAQQARGLAEAGYAVRVICGQGGPPEAPVELHIDPRFSARHANVLAVKRELDAGTVGMAFDALTDALTEALRTALDGCDVCIAHNVPSLHKNLPLTAALARIADVPLIAWCHDFAWTNPQYAAELHPGDPWDLLRRRWPHARYVTVSAARGAEMRGLLGLSEAETHVIPSGIDAARFLRWTSATQRIVESFRLLEADGILLLPARITRRKNIELALTTVAALRQQSGTDWRLVITGPPGPHNPSNDAYLQELLRLRASLNMDEAAHFCYALADPPFVPDDDTVADLYRLADALLFPSTQEGFGIPILEAGLSGLPIFCSRLPPFEESAGPDAHYFDPDTTSPSAIAALIDTTLAQSDVARLRRRVRRDWRLDRLLRERLIPLLELP